MKYTEHTLESAYKTKESAFSTMLFAVFSHNGETFATLLKDTHYLCMKRAYEAVVVSFIETTFNRMHSVIGTRKVTYLEDYAFLHKVEDVTHVSLGWKALLYKYE